MQVAPTVFAGMRVPTSTFVYDDPEHPDRPTGLVHSPTFTREDLGLILGWRHHRNTLCPGPCGLPRKVAWHSELEGWFDEGGAVVCHACTAMQPEPPKGKAKRPVTYPLSPVNTFTGDLPPFVLGETTTPAD